MRFRSVISVASERDLLHFRTGIRWMRRAGAALEKVKERWTQSRSRAAATEGVAAAC